MGNDLTARVKSLARELGADLVGVAPVERLLESLSEGTPVEMLPDCRSVVVMAQRIPWGSMQGLPTVSYLEFGYYGLEHELNSLAYKIAVYLEDEGYASRPTPAGRDIIGFDIQAREPQPKVVVRGCFPLREAAVAAGLGGPGVNGCVVTPAFGSRIRYVAVMTTAGLTSDPVIANPCAPEKCNQACVRACPAKALLGDGVVDHYRCLCINPDKADPAKALASLQERFKGSALVLAAKMISFAGTAPHYCALCLAQCPAGRMQKRTAANEYCLGRSVS